MAATSTPAPDSRTPGRHVHAGIVALLCVLASFLVYAPVLNGTFVWDDFYLVRENPFFRSPVFGLEVFRHYLFFDSFSTYYRPVQNWSYILDYWIWRGNPFGYHCTNVLIHGLSGFLLFLLLRQLLPRLVSRSGLAQTHRFDLAAFFLAMIWIVHPIHNAAVAYISGRADSLAALFALAAWLLLWQALRLEIPTTRRVLLGIAASLSLLIGLCAKEIALVWLLLLLVHLFAFERDHSRRAKWIVAAGALGIFATYWALHSLPGYRAPMENGPTSTWDARPLLMLRALGDYATLIFFPTKLYMERSISNPAIYTSVAAWREHARFEYLSIFGLLALLAAITGCLKTGPGRRWRIFGAAWFGLAFLPISNLIPLNAEVAEHWIYLASIGFLIFLAGIVIELPVRGQRAAAWLLVAAIAGLGARTAIRSADWVDAETFCVRTIADGGATPRILSALASIYGQRGDYPKQEQILRKMLAQFPDYAPARMNLGICLSHQGRKAEAEALLGAARATADEVARNYPRTWPAAVQLAQLRRDAGHPDEALSILQEAHSRFPETWELVKAEAEMLRETQSAAAALPLAENFAATHWWHYDAQTTLGALRFAAGKSDAAIDAFRAASRLDIYDGRALAGVAEIESARGHSETALEVQLQAMDRDPGQPKHYAELAAILQKLGRKEEAGAAMRKAQALAIEAKRKS